MKQLTAVLPFTFSFFLYAIKDVINRENIALKSEEQAPDPDPLQNSEAYVSILYVLYNCTITH